ncbi:hypothetical protein FIBSPDRAFT_890579 [Athelia psychrophila]|uniref:Uncharacterized protein n=1 Tax=Athelia psychrophila TaxID=1759441 RepID=A0A166KTI5_9AGAM|nr:hypothetical protein FIBSPDRAFT_890579 [Fibularhizoctonia sp. CBS 109695]
MSANIIETSTKTQSRAAPDHDLAEGATKPGLGASAETGHPLDARDQGGPSRKKTKDEKKNRRGANKCRRFVKARDDLDLFSGSMWEFGAGCRFTHDMAAYLPAKPKDSQSPASSELSDVSHFVHIPPQPESTDAERIRPEMPRGRRRPGERGARMRHPHESDWNTFGSQKDEWDSRAVMDGENALERMPPPPHPLEGSLPHLLFHDLPQKLPAYVDTTGVSEMSNPTRFGQECTASRTHATASCWAMQVWGMRFRCCGEGRHACYLNCNGELDEDELEDAVISSFPNAFVTSLTMLLQLTKGK